MNILIVEDEIAIAELLQISLTTCGYHAEYVLTGDQAIECINHHSYDLILLDIMLPHISGYELLSYIDSTPVIFITARSSLKDRVKGLSLGADDYIVKPFEMEELLARVESVLRRYNKGNHILQVYDIKIDTLARTVYKNDLKVSLTRLEYDLFLTFVRNQNIVLDRDFLYETVWKDELVSTRTLDLHVQRIRKKLGFEQYIQTVHRVGYRLEVAHEIGR